MNIPLLTSYNLPPNKPNATAADKLEYAEYQFYSGNNFTPADMRVLARIPQQGEPLLLGSLAMLSYSVHRDKFPVVSLGVRGTKGFTRGHRTIAGSLSFQSIDTDAFARMSKAMARSWGRNDSQYILADELPPFDIIVTAINDQGGSSVFGIYGVSILDFGTSFTLEQLIPSETYSFAATMVSAPRPGYEIANLSEVADQLSRTAFQAQQRADAAGNFEIIMSPAKNYTASTPLLQSEVANRAIHPPNETAISAELKKGLDDSMSNSLADTKADYLEEFTTKKEAIDQQKAAVEQAIASIQATYPTADLSPLFKVQDDLQTQSANLLEIYNTTSNIPNI